METYPLPLLTSTPPHWAIAVLSNAAALLNDHAHLERKAAANALALLNRWPGEAVAGGGGCTRDDWVRLLSAIARDETEHLALVLRTLHQRGGHLSQGHQNRYAAALHAHVRRGLGTEELVDRLLVCALIEARSCERFELLQAAADDRALASLYRGLAASESGHHRVFLELARALPAAEGIELRWLRWLELEDDTIRAQPPGATMHSGWTTPS